jgi:hypothetical protein
MPASDGSLRLYFVDIDNVSFFADQLTFGMRKRSHQFPRIANIQNDLGRSGRWQPWTARMETIRDFHDQPGILAVDQPFLSHQLAKW